MCHESSGLASRILCNGYQIMTRFNGMILCRKNEKSRRIEGKQLEKKGQMDRTTERARERLSDKIEKKKRTKLKIPFRE